MEVVNRYARAGGFWNASTAPPEVGRVASIGLTGLLALSALMLLTRRIAGALSEPLPTGLLVGVMLAAGTAALVGCLLREPDATHHRGARAEFWIVVVSLPLLAFALSVPASSAIGLSAMWLIVAGSEIGLLALRRHPRHPRRASDIYVDRRRVTSRLLLQDAKEEREAAADWNDLSLTQRLNYYRVAEGRCNIEGWLRINFAADQRTAIVHVAFCPALASQPMVEAEALDGTACEIRPTLVLPWGVRWEVRLDVPASEPTTAVLGFSAMES